ncbi:MAG: PP2C family protein-serine/threonine phosphatase [Deinococcus sp.]
MVAIQGRQPSAVPPAPVQPGRRSASPGVSAGLLSDVGRQRHINQDAALMLDLPGGGLFAVADGMGGHAAGELAANLALDTLSSSFLSGRGPVPERLANAVQAANLAVLRHAVGEYVGMGTTLIALVVDRGAALLAHVGDSRAYLLRGGKLHRLTEDHSWVAEQVRLGQLTEAQARYHQWRSVVSNALGGEERVRLELYGFPLQRGDRLLLCSDGLSGVLDDSGLHRRLACGQDPDTTARALVDAANAQGGPDNVTAIIADIGQALRSPGYTLPLRQEEGPQYVDALLRAQRGNTSATYTVLVTVYLILLAMVLVPEQRIYIGGLGLGALLLMLQLLGFLGHRQAGQLPGLPSYSPSANPARRGASNLTFRSERPVPPRGQPQPPARASTSAKATDMDSE